MNAIPHPELEALRTEFPILRTRTYLNSCSLGALSNRSMGYLGEYQALWNTLGASAWYELWMGRIDDLLERVAWFWNARRNEVALAPSVSGALSSIASRRAQASASSSSSIPAGASMRVSTPAAWKAGARNCRTRIPLRRSTS